MTTETSEGQTVTEVLVAAALEVQTVTEGRVAMEISEVRRVTEVLVAAALEGQTVTEALVAMEISAGQTATEDQMAVTSEGQMVTEVLREDLREPLQMADAETGAATKAVPSIRIV